MDIITIGIISVLAMLIVGELITIVLLVEIHKDYKDIKGINTLIVDFIRENNNLIKDYSETIKKMFDREGTMIELTTAINDQYKFINDNYKIVADGYSKMVSAYRETGENYKTIINTWAQCEQRYSDSFDQFKLCRDILNEVNGKLDELTVNGQHLNFEYTPNDNFMPDMGANS